MGDWCWWCWACSCCSVVMWMLWFDYKLSCGIVQWFLVIVRCMLVIVSLWCCCLLFWLLLSAVIQGIPWPSGMWTASACLVPLLPCSQLLTLTQLWLVCRACLWCMQSHIEGLAACLSSVLSDCLLWPVSRQIGHHALCGRCVKLRSLLSCSVGCCAALMHSSGLIACCVSFSSVLYSSLYTVSFCPLVFSVSSSKFVDPCQVLSVCLRCCEIHWSSNLVTFNPSCEFMNETLSSGSGSCCVCCGM